MAREQGYVLNIKMFLPVNSKDLSDTKAKADAVFQAQQNNDLSALAAAGADVMKVEHKFTSRAKAEVAVVHEPAETAEEIEGQAVEGNEPAEDVTADTGPEQVEATEAAASGRKRR